MIIKTSAVHEKHLTVSSVGPSVSPSKLPSHFSIRLAHPWMSSSENKFYLSIIPKIKFAPILQFKGETLKHSYLSMRLNFPACQWTPAHSLHANPRPANPCFFKILPVSNGCIVFFSTVQCWFSLKEPKVPVCSHLTSTHSSLHKKDTSHNCTISYL